MRWPYQGIFLIFHVRLSPVALSSLQAADFQTTWGERVFASDTFTAKVVGVSDVDTFSVMRGGRAVKVRLHGIASMGKIPEGGRYVQDLCTFCTIVPQNLDPVTPYLSSQFFRAVWRWYPRHEPGALVPHAGIRGVVPNKRYSYRNLLTSNFVCPP